MRRVYGTWEPSQMVLTENPKWQIREELSRNTLGRDGMFRSSNEGLEKGWSEGNMLGSPKHAINRSNGRNR